MHKASGHTLASLAPTGFAANLRPDIVSVPVSDALPVRVVLAAGSGERHPLLPASCEDAGGWLRVDGAHRCAVSVLSLGSLETVGAAGRYALIVAAGLCTIGRAQGEHGDVVVVVAGPGLLHEQVAEGV